MRVDSIGRPASENAASRSAGESGFVRRPSKAASIRPARLAEQIGERRPMNVGVPGQSGRGHLRRSQRARGLGRDEQAESPGMLRRGDAAELVAVHLRTRTHRIDPDRERGPVGLEQGRLRARVPPVDIGRHRPAVQAGPRREHGAGLSPAALVPE